MTRTTAVTLLASAAVLLCGGDAGAQLPWAPPGGLDSITAGAAAAEIVLLLDSTIRVADLSAAELLGTSATAFDAGPVAVSAAFGLTASLGDPVTELAVADTVQRSLGIVYQAWIRNVSGNLHELQIGYELASYSGTPDRLEHALEPSSHIGIICTPTGPEVVAKDGPWRLIEGGGLFELDVSAATVAGAYRGSLTVVINIL